MKRRVAGRSAEPRRCALCGGLLPAAKPVFLLHTPSGSIVGPYHSGCAEKVVIRAEVDRLSAEAVYRTAERFGFRAREETLPW